MPIDPKDMVRDMYSAFFKRFIDILLSGACLLVGWPFLAIIAVANVDALAEVELMDAMFLAGKYILRQAVTVLISVLCINIVVFARYDRKGIRRASWKELLGRDE